MADVSKFFDVGKYGSVGTILAYIAWQIATQMPSLQKSQVEIQAGIQAMNVQHQEIRMSTDSTQKILRGICLNTATTKEEISRCNE